MYNEVVDVIIKDIFDNQLSNIKKACSIIKDVINNNGNFYIIGTGHSHMMAEEFYIMQPSNKIYKPILLPELMLHQFPNKSTYIERLEGYANIITTMYPLTSNDCMMLVSNSGRNGMMVELADIAKRKNAKVITVTNLQQAQVIPSRHTNGKNIIDYGTVNISNCGKFGDCAYTLSNGTKCGPTSTISTTLIAQLIHLILTTDSDIDSALTTFKQTYCDLFEQSKKIRLNETTQLFFETIQNKHDIYFYGIGPNHIFAEEVYLRAGGFCNIKAILEDELMLHQGREKLALIMQDDLYANLLINKYHIKANDTVCVVSNKLDDPLSRNFIKLLYDHNVNVVVISNHDANDSINKYINIWLQHQCTQKYSSSIVSFIIQNLLVELAQFMLTKGFQPPILTSGNIDNSEQDNRNNQLIKEMYFDKFLYQSDF